MPGFREFALEPANNQRLASLCGPLDAHLRLVETRYEVQIRRRGHAFRVRGRRRPRLNTCCATCSRRPKVSSYRAEHVHLALS